MTTATPRPVAFAGDTLTVGARLENSATTGAGGVGFASALFGGGDGRREGDDAPGVVWRG